MKTVVVAKALILDSDGHMLMLRRSDTHPTLSLRRDLPGGQVDKGEEPGDAVAREILEETMLKVQKNQLSLVYAGTEVHHDENMVRLLYVAKLDAKKPVVTLSWEHSTAEWTDISELETVEQDFHSFYHNALQHVRTHNLLDQ
jgi:8-oxo-dGTP pyrophosphatase MutT (NUDIX family)